MIFGVGSESLTISGKILWIQQWVMEGKIVLVQVLTLWNLSEIGTKLLSGQRMKLLMHELTMAHGDCSGLVGQAEFEEQCQRHGNGKQVARLAKAVARVMLLSGLGSSTINGVGALLVFLWRIFKMAKDSFDSYEHLYTQHAILDSAYNGPQSTSRSLSGLEETI